ncbi:hypothetical protein CRG98_007619 [Punica granatum]|uniref:Uncharacterized protein n=1 Tax=Punica granatum TaxID=22663 RepID=A0A2I0KUI7_PUNGR|nr:hypothetical protein CRG98_007619 [Punica granatum]
MENFCFGDANGGPAFRGPDARPSGLLLALHGHIETFSKVPKRLYRLFDAPAALKRGFRPSRLNFLSLEFARAKGPMDSTSECVVLCFRLGVATAASLFVGVMGLCSGEGPICPGVSLNLGGDPRVEVERFVRLSLSSASWGVHIRRKPPSSKYEERVREEFSGRCEPVYRSLPVTGVSLDHSPVGDVTVLVTFAAGGQGHALFVRAVACDLLWREGWDSMSKFQGAGREVFIVLIVVVQGTVLSMDGGSRLKSVNSLKSSEDLWGLVWWHSRLDPFPYSEPLTNLASYFGARAISDEATRARGAGGWVRSNQRSAGEPVDSHCNRWTDRAPRNEDALHRIYNREIETPKVDGMGHTNETRTRTGRHFFVCRSRCFRLPNA